MRFGGTLTPTLSRKREREPEGCPSSPLPLAGEVDGARSASAGEGPGPRSYVSLIDPKFPGRFTPGRFRASSIGAPTASVTGTTPAQIGRA